MTVKGSGRRATVHDVAREARVSLATVDRVLNGRPGVRATTAERVEAAIRALDFRRDLSASLLARARDLSIAFFIPDGRNEFMANLQSAVARSVRAARAERIVIDMRHVEPSIPKVSPARSMPCSRVVATVPSSLPPTTNASGGPSTPPPAAACRLTLVSDPPGSSRRHFVGIDTSPPAARRPRCSAACVSGKIGIVAGSLGLRDHRERPDGFTTLLAAEFPGHPVVGPIEGRDDNSVTEREVARLLTDHPDLSGLYNLGAGNAGLVAAIEKSGRAGRLRVVAHELSAPTRAGLETGVIDVVLDQNPDGEIRAALAAARALALGNAADLKSEPIEIGIFLRDNLRQEGNPT